jgi:AAA domain
MQTQEAAAAASVEPATVKPTIHRLAIDRFRGIETFSWHPAAGVNLILGGGDVGKTTILDAIAFLLSPTNSGNLSDTDYYLRRISDEFVIEAVMSLPQDGSINQQAKPAWPWEWNGSEPAVPSVDAEGVGSRVSRPATANGKAIRRAKWVRCKRVSKAERDAKCRVPSSCWKSIVIGEVGNFRWRESIDNCSARNCTFRATASCTAMKGP